jgi:OOP family OmpA-OmpF porin
MKPQLKCLWATSLFALAAGCSTASVEELSRTQPVGSEYNKQLTKEYTALANYEAYEMIDVLAAERYAAKGMAAAQDRPSLPDEIWSRELPKQYGKQLTDARMRLVDAQVHGARERYPTEAAAAQAKFDCWLEQQEENDQPTHIAACRDSYAQAMQAIDAKESSRLSKQDTPDVSRASDAVASKPDPEMLIYFDFDKSTVDSSELGKIERIAAKIEQSGGLSKVTATGHTDRSGSASYNQDLALRRANFIRDALSDRGVSSAAIGIVSMGESDAREPTADGVREAENRRVQISILR